jgi:membrane fusion protein (multidrug efflux system)
LRVLVQFGAITALQTAIGVAAFAAFAWWTHGRFIESTNDAYLRADAMTVAPRVSGYVQAVLVSDNQPVIAGQPLVRIESANYDAVLAGRDASVQVRQAEVVAAQRQLRQQSDVVAHAAAELSGARISASYASGEARRMDRLRAEEVETSAHAALATSQAGQAQAAVKAAEATFRQAQDQTETLLAQAAQAQAQLHAAEADARAARLSRDDTVIRAAISGVVGDRMVRVGQFVQPGTRLLSVVPVQDIYVVANFKETQVARIRVGQVASVAIDALGGRRLPARVVSFAPGTGSQFALLPAENATGNFTKIVQRIPVRLHLDAPAGLRDHLAPGLSVTVRIDTHQAGSAAK